VQIDNIPNGKYNITVLAGDDNSSAKVEEGLSNAVVLFGSGSTADVIVDSGITEVTISLNAIDLGEFTPASQEVYIGHYFSISFSGSTGSDSVHVNLYYNNPASKDGNELYYWPSGNFSLNKDNILAGNIVGNYRIEASRLFNKAVIEDGSFGLSDTIYDWIWPISKYYPDITYPSAEVKVLDATTTGKINIGIIWN